MMSRRVLTSLLFAMALAVTASAQVTIPRESNRQEVWQIVGDTKITINYHRPNAKGRAIWGGLVPYGEVWRTGANDATIFEISNDVTVNGQKLPKGKYSLHSIPTTGAWTLIFNKTWNQWGSFQYDQKEDQLRVASTPVAAPMQETMSIDFVKVMGNTAEIHIKWGELAVPMTIDVGDFNARFINENQRRTATERMTLAGYILSQKLTGSYNDALMWAEDAERMSPTNFGVLSFKARLLAEMGRKADAIAAGERAIAAGKAATPAANTTAVENLVKQLKAGQ